MKPPLNKFKNNVYSQNGEDGIIQELILRMEISLENGWAVEFGAWDGMHCSNTFLLVKDHAWHAVYIEGDAARFNDLLNTAKDHPTITPINAFVERYRGQSNCLDNLLAQTTVPNDFDLLSIDIDSYDLDIWESLERYSAKIVVIEINSGVLPGVIWRHSQNTPGNTFTASVNVGMAKGYTLVCHTGNLIFVRNDFIERINLEKRFILCPEGLFSYEWIPKDPLSLPRKTLIEQLRGCLKKLVARVLT
jgi:hypothetical protein